MPEMAKRKIGYGKALKAWRGDRSMAIVAEVLGCSEGFYCRCEQETRRPSPKTWREWSIQTGLELATLDPEIYGEGADDASKPTRSRETG